MPFNLGGPELIIVLVIVLIVFGAGKLPSVMKDVGRGVKEFKKAQTEEEMASAGQTTMTSSSNPGATNGANTTGTAGTAGTTASTATRPTEPAPRA
ncbi:MAG TPA: twin-arginine translocase TatA/TatE family subunit [Chloroflexota bacterium]|jgi:sec-independent protein translocase protein TatA|nr:twin-arginine translocase TatA/TatE family subunit [Chloroflexota bacterium]